MPDAGFTMKCAGELPSDCRCRISVFAKVRRHEDGASIVARTIRAPKSSFK
jgi:hypothetical protein